MEQDTFSDIDTENEFITAEFLSQRKKKMIKFLITKISKKCLKKEKTILFPCLGNSAGGSHLSTITFLKKLN